MNVIRVNVVTPRTKKMVADIHGTLRRGRVTRSPKNQTVDSVDRYGRECYESFNSRGILIERGVLELPCSKIIRFNPKTGKKVETEIINNVRDESRIITHRQK